MYVYWIFLAIAAGLSAWSNSPRANRKRWAWDWFISTLGWWTIMRLSYVFVTGEIPWRD